LAVLKATKVLFPDLAEVVDAELKRVGRERA